MSRKWSNNTIVRTGIIVNTVGLFFALFVNLHIGIILLGAGLIVSIVGLVLCLRQKGNTSVAGFYVLLNLLFLAYVSFFA